MNLSELLKIQPFSLRKAEKGKLLDEYLTTLSRHHYSCCEPYRKMMDGMGFNRHRKYHYSDLAYIPVRLFKLMELCSVPKDQIVNTLTSSGTSGYGRSMIYLDKENAANQTKVLSKIVTSFIGTKRTPMIILDTKSTVSNRNLMSASAAGILGFSLFGSKRMFALNDEMELNIEELMAFTEKFKEERISLFGFTFKVYQYFYKELQKAGVKPDLSNAVFIHGGGWKKLEKEAISSKAFRRKLNDVCGIRSVHDYYGMAEQAGSIFMECEHGHFHASIFSEMIIRRSIDFSMANPGEEGIIQVLSVVPTSYPGHSLLTEDKGILLGEDDCPCGRFGKYFHVTGRLENAEIKGCSDSYEEHFK